MMLLDTPVNKYSCYYQRFSVILDLFPAFIATFHAFVTTPKHLYLKVFQGMCDSVTINFAKINR